MLTKSDKQALLASPEARSIERRLLLRGGLSLGLLTALTGCDVTDGHAVQDALVAMSRWNDRVQGFLFSGERLARTYSEGEIRRPWRYNAYYPAEQTPVVDGATYRLRLEGAVGKPDPWTVQQVQALPAVSQITRHVCVEGWSAIGKWTGVPFKTFLQRVDADLTAKFVYFTCADGYTVGLDMPTCLHPQTLLATQVNDEVLAPKYGYPLKLRVPTKLGFKNPKLITSIWVGNEDRGGYWDDPRGKGVSTGYNWFSGL